MDDNDYLYDEGYTPESQTYQRPERPADNNMRQVNQTRRPAPYAGPESLRPTPERQQQQPVPDTGLNSRDSHRAPATTAPEQRRTAAPKPQKPAASTTRQAAKPQGPRQTEPAKPLAIVRFFTDERTRVFLGIMLLIISVFVVMAVFSHFHVGAKDQSVVINLPLSEIAREPGSVRNALGPFGAWLSYVLLCDFLGLGSLMLIVWLWEIGLKLLGKRRCNFWATTFRCMLVAITVSTVLGLVSYNWATVMWWGGLQGHYVNKFLFEYATIIGAILYSVLLVSAVMCIYLNEITRALKKWKEAARRHSQQLREERERIIELARRKAEQEGRKEDYEFEDDEHDEGHDDTPAPAEEPGKIKPIVSPITNVIATITERLQQKSHGTPTEGQPAPTEGTQTTDSTANTAESGTTPAAASPTGEKAEIGPNFTVFMPEIELPDNVGAGDKPVNDLFDHRAELSRYKMPTIDLLEDRPSGPEINLEEQQANKERIERTLLGYNIPISRIEATVGPTVTLYEIVPAEGVRISQIKRLEDDIALSLSALGIRIIAPIPGKGTVGIEVPNRDPKTVSMRSVINSRKFQECTYALPMAMGATISNEIFIADLAKMPHLLVAGATGMGKSVGLNAIIASLLYKKHPTELKFVLVDPKMVEFSLYSKLERHYLAKLPNNDDAIITDMKNVVETLNSLCIEMDHRYELLRDANVRALEEYNKKFTERRLNPEKGHRYLPYIVVVVDEFADLIMTQGKEVETPIARIAQKARAVGIHMILATQRPSTNVITGLIKANFPGRIAFRVIQMVDSRTILDCPGANQLIGRGDMLFSHNGIMERVQCAFISTEEVEQLTEYIDEQMGFEKAYELPEYVPEEVEGGVLAGASMERDSLFDEAARFVVSRQMGSTSSLQRQFGVGYNRAGKLMDQMEAAGIVGPVNGSKPRNILVDMMTLETMLSQS